MFIWLKCPIMNNEHASNTWNNLCLHNIMDYTTQKMVWLWELGTFAYKFIEFCVSPVVGNIIEVVVEVSQVSVLFLLQQHSWRLTRVFIYRVSARANIHRMLNKCRQARKSHFTKVGIEPTIPCLQVRCSTTWAPRAESSAIGLFIYITGDSLCYMKHKNLYSIK